MHDNISNPVLQFFANHGVQLKVITELSENSEMIGQMQVVIFSNEQRTRELHASMALNTGQINLIVTRLSTDARLVLGPGRSEGDVTHQLDDLARNFPDLFDVVSGKTWVNRPFDWGDYK